MRVLSVLLLCGAILPATAGAQSLANIARQEEARRKGVADAPKVYTNKDLKPAQAPAPAPPSESAAASSTEAAAPSPASAPGKGAPTKDAAAKDPAAKDRSKPLGEDEWRGRMKALTDSAEHDRLLLDALQARVNALTSDVTNRDDPAQRAVLTVERVKALAEMDRLKKALADDKAAAAALEEEARRAGVPPGWLR